MIGTHRKISKQIAHILLCLHLVVTLSGFIANVNPSDCCHTKKEIKKVHSCCEEMKKEEPMSCELSQPISGHSLANCGCIHTNPDKNSECTVQKNFELQKNNHIAVIPFYEDLQTQLFNANFKQKIEKVHSPPLFILDATLRI